MFRKGSSLKTPSPRFGQGWRPWPLRVPFFVLFLVLCGLLCVLVELIVRGCSATGCHVFGTWSTTEMPSRSYFAYNLFPTALSLCLGLLWAVPHHDIMRLEPYFQMSTEGGATAVDSIFLEYSYTYSWLVPARAVRHRHYVVLLSSCSMLLMSFLVTPLIAGVFDDTIVQKSIAGKALRNDLYPEVQNVILHPPFTFAAYDYLWLNASLPAFTTPTYALLPVRNETSLLVSNEVWEGNTTLFEAEISCENAMITGLEYTTATNLEMTVTSNNGSSIIRFCDQRMQYGLPQTLNNSCNSYTTFATPWTSITYIEPNSNTMTVAWASGGDSAHTSNGSYLPRNITALSCKISYYSEPVTAMFDMPTGVVNDVVRSGDRTAFLPAKNFGKVLGGLIDAFGAVPGSISDSVPLPYVAFGAQPLQQPDVDPFLQKTLGKRPDNADQHISGDGKIGAHTESHSSVYMFNTYGLAGFALANETPNTLERLLDPDILAQTYERSVRLLFSLAVTEGMIDRHVAEEINVTRHVLTRGFVVNSLWARGVQGGLAVVFLLTIALAISIGQRPCHLDGEPNSIAAALRLLRSSPELSKMMSYSEFCSPEDLQEKLSGYSQRYYLELVEGEGPAIRVSRDNDIPIPLDQPSTADVDAVIDGPHGSQSRTEPWSERIWLLSAWLTVGFVLGLLIVATVLVLAAIYARQHNGLPTIAPTNSFAYKILFSYIPIVVGMTIEPVLISLGSYHCMLGPYNVLKSQPAPSAKTLTVDYKKSPPHFQILRSLRTGNLTLASLSIAIILSSVLAVTLAGLFSLITPEVMVPMQVKTHSHLYIQGSFTQPAREMYYILSEHLSRNLSMPAWTTDEYYVVPFDPVGGGKVVKYESETLGIGIDVGCTIVEAGKVSRTCGVPGGNSTAQCLAPAGKNFWSTIQVDDPCWGYKSSNGITGNLTMYGSSLAMLVSSYDCPSTFFAGWSDPPSYVDTDEEVRKLNGNLLIKCTVRDKVVGLTAAADEHHKVLSVTNIHPLHAERLVDLYPANTSAEAYLTSSFMHSVITGLDTENSGSLSYKMCWPGHLMATIEPSLVRDPAGGAFLPDPRLTVRTFEEVFRRLFVVNMWLNADEIVSLGESRSTPGTVIVRVDKVYVSKLMFYIAISILVMIVVVVVALRWGQETKFIGHLPVSLLGIYTHLYASNAGEECVSVKGTSPAERAKILNTLGGRYKYGWFSANAHHGVYRYGGLNELSGEIGNGE